MSSQVDWLNSTHISLKQLHSKCLYVDHLPQVKIFLKQINSHGIFSPQNILTWNICRWNIFHWISCTKNWNIWGWNFFEVLFNIICNGFWPGLCCAGVQGHGHLQEGLLSGEKPALLSGNIQCPYCQQKMKYDAHSFSMVFEVAKCEHLVPIRVQT